MKSKRQCLGYDPVFQTQGQHSIHPASGSLPTSKPPASSAVAGHPRKQLISHEETARSGVINTLPVTSSPLEYPFAKQSEILPMLNQPYDMNNANQGIPPYATPIRRESAANNPISWLV